MPKQEALFLLCCLVGSTFSVVTEGPPRRTRIASGNRDGGPQSALALSESGEEEIEPGTFTTTTPRPTAMPHLPELAGFLKNVVYPQLYVKYGNQFSLKDIESWFQDELRWNLFGIACKWEMKGGVHQFEWKFDGEIRCDGLDRAWKDGCPSRGCAFKYPLNDYFKALVRKGLVKPKQITREIQDCNCGFHDYDVNELSGGL